MTQLLVVIVSALLVIAGSTVVGPRLGIASPLVLVAIGVAASFMPLFGATHIEPEWILEGVLPPLLYSSAVSMPAMNFRREFGAISSLSVLLVVASALVLGVFFMLVLPDLGFAWGVALGAIVSPTDAVATSIIKQTSVSKRVVAMLDGESLLNDATALVLLRTAIVATAASFSFWGSVATFGYSVVAAVAVGWFVGWLNLAVRKRVTDSTVNTVISFTVPFVASVPAEALGASGLVAAVVAGIITGIRAPRDLSPRNRLSDSQNWRTIELVLEGTVFLTMGVQIRSIVTSVQQDHGAVGMSVLIALGALALTLLVRAAYVGPLLSILSWRARHGEAMQPRIQDMRDKMSTPEGKQEMFEAARTRRPGGMSERQLDRLSQRITQGLANIEYFLREPLGWREGAAVVWAGMRGAVTVAAAQTLPENTPLRSVLVLIAFSVAMLSLLIQGGTIGPLLKLVPDRVDQDVVDAQITAEHTRLMELLRTTAEAVPEPPYPEGEATQETFALAKERRLKVIDAQRAALLDERDAGTFDAEVLENALMNLDAAQISIELRGRLAG